VQVPAYLEHQAAPGVWLLESESIEMDMIAAIRGDLTGVEVLGADLPTALPDSRDTRGEAIPLTTAASIALRKPFKGKKRVHGLIVYSSMTALIDFLIEFVAPEGDGPLDQALLAARSDSHPDKAKLEGLLFGSSVRHPGHLEYDWTDITDPMPLVERHEVERHATRLPLHGKTYRMLSVTRRFDGRPFMAVTKRQRLNRHVIPRVGYIMSGVDWRHSDSLRGHEFSVLSFDGRGHAWHSSIHDVPAPLLDAISRRGRLYAGAAFDVLPQGHLKARAVVRLPSAKEAQEHVSRAEKTPRAPIMLLRRPGFMLPSLAPIRLPRSTPVIDNPSAALFAWLRTTRGIYIPDDRPRSASLARLRTQPTYLILADPRLPNG